MGKSNYFNIDEKRGGKALLVEPEYKAKFPSIGLLKFSTFLKQKGYSVKYVKGEKLIKGDFDEILITSFFTYDWRVTVDTIKHYLNAFQSSNIRVGGIYASLLPDHIYQKSGVIPHYGCIPEVDECSPDYNLLPRHFFKETSQVFTSRGCNRSCTFCGTKILEPDRRLILNWKKHFLPGGKYAFIHDNNILAQKESHFFEVINFLKEGELAFMFGNGLDCRLFTYPCAKALRKTPITEIRFAFDTLKQDGFTQDAIRLCKKAGIPASKIKVFILYNYKDDLDDALYRAEEVFQLGANPWACRYKPLDWLHPNITYIDEDWELEDLHYFNSYVNRYNIMKKFTYDEWKERKLIEKEMNLKSRKWNIENIINKGMEEAEKNSDKESLFDDPRFIMSIIKGKDFL